MGYINVDVKEYNIDALSASSHKFYGPKGVGFSYILSVGINSLISSSDMGLGNICRIPLWLSPLAIAFAILVGMVAGFLPSLRAMRLSPLAAIRNE